MLALLLLACTEKPQDVKQQPPKRVVSVSFPAHYLVERLFSEIPTTCILPEKEDPMHWHPKPEDVAELSTNTLIVSVGSGYEAWMQTAALPSRSVLSLNSNLKLLSLHGQTHSHGKSGDHSHAGDDPFVWLNPKLYLQQAEFLHLQIERIFPEKSQHSKSQLDVLKTELEELSTQMDALQSKYSTYQIVSDQSLYAYLGSLWSVDIHSFHFSDLDPGAASLGIKNKEKVMLWYEAGRPSVMLWSFSPKEELLKSFPPDMKHVYVDPLTHPIDGQKYNYVQQYTENIQRLSTL